MNIFAHMERLDALILKHTTAPATADLRNQLSTVREQIEALHSEHLTLKNTYAMLKNVSEEETSRLKDEIAKLIIEEKAQMVRNAAHPAAKKTRKQINVIR